MSARDKLPPAETAQDLADTHDRLIVRCKQLAWPVEYKGANRFVAGYCHHDGDAEMVVYLKGVAGEVRPCEITILEKL